MPPVQWGEGKKAARTHKHKRTHTRGNMYVLLLQITTCASHHSSDNTQYYANRRLCDSVAVVCVAHTAPLTADQPYLHSLCVRLQSVSPSSPTSGSSSQNGSLPVYFTVRAIFSRTSHSPVFIFTILIFGTSKLEATWIRRFFSFFLALLSLICSAVWPLTYWCCHSPPLVYVLWLSVKPNLQPRLIRLDPRLTFKPLNFQVTSKCTEPVTTITAGASFFFSFTFFCKLIERGKGFNSYQLSNEMCHYSQFVYLFVGMGRYEILTVHTVLRQKYHVFTVNVSL